MNNSNNTPEDRNTESKLDRILNESTNSMFENTRSVANASNSEFASDDVNPTIIKAKTEINAQTDSMLKEIEERRRRRAVRQQEFEMQVKAESEARAGRTMYSNQANSNQTSRDVRNSNANHNHSGATNQRSARPSAQNRAAVPSARRNSAEQTRSTARRRMTVSAGETQIMPKITESGIPSRSGENTHASRQRNSQTNNNRRPNSRPNNNGKSAPMSRTSQKSTRKPNNKPKEVDLMKEIREWVVAIAIAVVAALLIRNFVFTLVKVQGESMSPTLSNNDRLYVNRFFYSPKKGDVVIFKPASDPDRPYIKRVIATEGDTVYIDFETGDIYVNGEVIDEPYIKEKTSRSGSYINKLIANGSYSKENPIVVEKNKIFVMGDNRNNSTDSRMIGQVPEDEIIGGAVFRFWPLGNFGSVNYDMSYLIEDEDNNFSVIYDKAA